MKELFYCKVKGCADQKSGRPFNSATGLVGHYRFKHGSVELGRRQVALQRKAAGAEADIDPMAEVEQFPHGATLSALEAQFDETGEPLPAPLPVESMDDAARESDRVLQIGETNIDLILEEHIGRIGKQIETVQQRADEAKAELTKLQEEMTRALAARKAYAMEVKSRYAGETQNGE